MSDFKKMMAERNKKAASPKEEISKVPANREYHEDKNADEIEQTVPLKDCAKGSENTPKIPKSTEPGDAEDEPLRKTSFTISKRAANYIRINSKRARESQREFLESLILDMVKTEKPVQEINYDDFIGLNFDPYIS